MKKKTYTEEEYWGQTLFSVISGMILTLFIIYGTYIMLNPISPAPEKIPEYYETAKGFCDHFGGTLYLPSYSYVDHCIFEDEYDSFTSCEIIRINDRYYFKEDCEALK